MSKLTKPRFILYLALIFLAGGVTGAVSWNNLWKSNSHHKRSYRKPPTMQDVIEHQRQRLQERLDLTQEQVALIDPILEATAREMEEAHREAMVTVCEIHKKSNEKIGEVLTPEQRAKLDAMEKEWNRFKSKKGYSSSSKNNRSSDH